MGSLQKRGKKKRRQILWAGWLSLVFGAFFLSGCAGRHSEEYPPTGQETLLSGGETKGGSNALEDPANAGEGEIDGDSLVDAAAAEGQVLEFASSGCTLAAVKTGGDLAQIPAAGETVSGEDRLRISYQKSCTFWKAVLDTKSGRAEVAEASLSDVKKGTTLLIFGERQPQGEILAERVMILSYTGAAGSRG